ncbi:MAG TPA: M36 family metallopeptidase, partial [Candidatus Dormibacteraeota bacterium]|nr:M36 family metallopeptidase [Candidatus Dormibacteraeota bacterium]
MNLSGSMVTFTGIVLLSTETFAFQQPANPRLTNFDNRTFSSVAGSTAPDDKAGAIAAIRKQIPNLRIEFHPITRAPKTILNPDGFLTGPDGSGGVISKASLGAIPGDEPNRVTKAFLHEHSKLFGHGPEALDQALIKREFVTANNGMRTVVWEQQVDQVPVFEAVLVSHTTARGELVNIASQFIANPHQAADRGATNRAALLATPPINARQAVTAAASNVGEAADVNLVNSLGAAAATAEKKEKFMAPFLLGEAEAKLTWLPMDEQTLRLCWDVTFMSRQRGEMFRVLVDAETGTVQVRNCLTDYLSDATYRVFTSDSPSPFSPGYSSPISTQPPSISRSLVTLPAVDTNASPLGWINDGGNETLGNNVDAHTDLNNDNLPDLPRPQGSPARVFDFAMDLTTQNPTAYSQAAVVQLFYWNNFMHDKLYELGFTEAAGNFQSNNFGRGGLGNDAVQADAQDGGGFNNANFSTPADGSPGRMQMYVFNGPTPQRDGDLDAEIVLHEYTHGLSNRRVGGGVGISALQPSGMGEGWSDFYGLTLLSEAGDDVNGVYAAGAYATYQLSGMTQNYYFGIRRYPYCTDMSKNPLTFKDIDPPQASAHTGIPRSTIIGTTANEVHNMGEVWCVTLWDARVGLINKYGWAVGNQRILQLVTDGMNLSPANPNFLQARDAIIQADLVDYGGANRAQLWAAFAKRGMGLSATSPSSSTTTGLVEAYDLPDDLQIGPPVLSSSGPVGGPFTPNPCSFTLSNAGTNTLTWSLASTNGWFSVSPANGTLSGGATTTVSVLIGPVATNFSLGSSNSTIWFTNQTSGIAQARTFSLSIVGRTLFENFEPDIHFGLWSAFGGTPGSTIIATNYGGSISGVNSLWFGDAGTRSAATIPVNTSAGGMISFYLRLGNGSFPWETVDIPGEGIVLEYSTNNGASWTVMGTYDTSTFYGWTQVTTNIPGGAVSAATEFRWRQLSHSGTCCDHWALDDVSIDAGPTPPSIFTQPVSQTVKSGSNVTFTISAQGSFPLIYKWRKNGTNLLDGGRISGATNTALNISTLVESDSGQYSVLVTNIYGSVTSSIATLLVTPLDHFEWSVISSPQAVGTPFGATITAKDFLNVTVTNFTGTVNLSGSAGGGQTTNTILGAPAYMSSGSGSYTLGYSFTPNTNMTVTHVRHYFGTKISIWTDAGSLLAAQNVTSTPGAWTETALPTPIQLSAGVTYRVAAYTGAGSYYWRTDLGGTFTNGVITQGYEGSGDAFPVSTDAVRWWFVDLRYTVNGSAPVAVSPASAGPFTNGVWSGAVAVQAPATNVILRADEAGGHSGLSNPFDVLLQNDLSISIADSPDPVSVGATLTYALTIANVGPSAASAVTVTNILPAAVTFVSATSSQGSCAQSAGVVTCNLGTVAGGTNAAVTIVAVPTTPGVLTNTATVSRAEADPYLGNNTAIATTLAQVPAISIGDRTILEGNSGITNATFTVSLSVTAPLPVSVNYATADGTALAGADYVSTNGTLTFAPGQTNKTIVVAVKGDTTGEPDETFFVNLSGATNATLADAQGLGTILNDDVPPAAYVRSTAGAPWGSTANETAMNRVFGSNNWQDLRYETLSTGGVFSAAATCIYMEGSDMDAAEMETFLMANLGSIQSWVSNGGSLFLNAAPNEDNGMDFGFGVTLLYPDQTSTAALAVPAHPIFNGPFTPVGTNWTGGSFAHATVTGTGLTVLITNTANGHIVLGEKAYGAGHVLFGGMTTDNFHTPQPQASNLRANIIAYLNSLSTYHFEWSAILSPRQFNVPFPVTITARDVTNGIVSTFNGAVSFSASGGG